MLTIGNKYKCLTLVNSTTSNIFNNIRLLPICSAYRYNTYYTEVTLKCQIQYTNNWL